MSSLAVVAKINRRSLTKRNYDIRIVNTARFVFCYGVERLTVLVWGIADNEAFITDFYGPF